MNGVNVEEIGAVTFLTRRSFGLQIFYRAKGNFRAFFSHNGVTVSPGVTKSDGYLEGPSGKLSNLV